MRRRHRHCWRVKAQETHPSAFEQIAEAGIGRIEHIDWELFERPVVVTYSCCCGAERVERV